MRPVRPYSESIPGPATYSTPEIQSDPRSNLPAGGYQFGLYVRIVQALLASIHGRAFRGPGQTMLRSGLQFELAMFQSANTVNTPSRRLPAGPDGSQVARVPEPRQIPGIGPKTAIPGRQAKKRRARIGQGERIQGPATHSTPGIGGFSAGSKRSARVLARLDSRCVALGTRCHGTSPHYNERGRSDMKPSTRPGR